MCSRFYQKVRVAVFPLRKHDSWGRTCKARDLFSGGKQGSQTPKLNCVEGNKRQMRKRHARAVERTVKVKKRCAEAQEIRANVTYCYMVLS
jgi:hypothetical protein